ncbi:MAG: hypothetical protein COA42_11760 [Alteromonadaceae bacterium]|nr:MAG: hypothetical protein COA42_11760 [Alteromonadaceae bacterium]
MASSAELKRLNALIMRLVPLTKAAPGELVRADDWNTIVSTLIEVGRATYTEAESQEVPAHSHLDEVSIGWLDSALSTQVNGSLSDPVQEGKINSLERQIKRLGKDISGLKLAIQNALGEVDRVATRDLSREKVLQGLDLRVDGLRDARDDVAELRLTLQGLNQQITTVQNIGDQLRDRAGEIIDVSKLNEQVNELSVLREQLRDANGEVVTGIGIDQKIAEALNKLLPDSGTSDPSNTLPTDGNVNSDLINALIKEEVDSRIALALDERITTTLNDFRNSVDSNINRQLEGLDAQIRSAIDTEFPRLESRVQVDLQNQLAENTSAVDALINKQITTAFESRINSGELLSGSNRELLVEELSQTLDERMSASFKELGLTDQLIGIDDFTALEGIGATYHNRLQAAKITSYADLASISPEEVSKITNLSVDRIKELDVIGQAKLIVETQR